MATKITVSVIVDATMEHVWNAWTTPSHIMKWNAASDDWHTTKADNDFQVGGKFSFRMEAKDNSFGFDFEGVYDQIRTNEFIEYTMADGRKSDITFRVEGNQLHIHQTFDAETENTIELQQYGWQSILNNFKKHVEH